jgi:YHS domain-containing protein
MTKLLDPVCDMVVDLEDARDHGLTLELPDREYAFCAHGCLTKFAKSPETYKAKVDAWLAAEAAGEQAAPHGHSDAVPTIDQGMREWYKSCRCCLSDAYPKVVEQLDAERASLAQAPSDAGICETAEAQQPGHP